MNNWYLTEYAASERQRELTRTIRHNTLIRQLRMTRQPGIVSRWFNRHFSSHHEPPQALSAKPHTI